MNNKILTITNEVGVSTNQKEKNGTCLRLPYMKPSLSILFVESNNCILMGSVNHGMKDYVNVEDEAEEEINAGEFTF